MQRPSRNAWLLACGLSLAACGSSSSSPPAGSPDATTTDTAASDAPPDVPDLTPDTVIPDGPDPCSGGLDCSKCFDRKNCLACASVADPSGSASFGAIFAKHCACGATSPCAGPCTSESVCAGADASTTSQACTDCMAGLTGLDACIKDAFTECSADVTCKKFLSAVQICPAS